MIFSELKTPVIVLAPLSGVTDYPFRCLVRKYGNPSLMVSEMIASTAVVRQVKKTLKRCSLPEEIAAVQLVGNDPAIMAEAARVSVDLGARIIDINMGCPVRKMAINSHAGAALMKDEILSGKIFDAVIKAVSIPVTVKMRKGWDENSQNALKIGQIAKKAGISFVTLHGRTRSQLFNGKVDWDFIYNFQQSLDLPVIGNGDITTVENAAEHIKKVSGIMIGRGCYGKPWFLQHVRHFIEKGEYLPTPSIAEQHEIVQEHFESMMTYYGNIQGVAVARKHLAWYSKGFPNATEFRSFVFQETCPTLIKQAIYKFYNYG